MVICQQKKKEGHDQIFCLLFPSNIHSFVISDSNYLSNRVYKFYVLNIKYPYPHSKEELSFVTVVVLDTVGPGGWKVM